MSEMPTDPAQEEDEAPMVLSDEAVEYPIDGILDLHTFRPSEVADLVQDYLDECQRLGVFEIRIIHGKGKGTLMNIVHAGLKKRDDVQLFQIAPRERGGRGATLVTLRLRSPSEPKT